MEDLDILPTAFAQVQKSLAPFIKTRQEIGHIRQLLTAHLEAQISHKAEETKAPTLSLVNSSVQANSSSTIRGLRREYLKSLRLNIEARRKYDVISHRYDSAQGNSISHGVVPTDPCLHLHARDTDARAYLEGYLDLVKLRQRHERLRILQDYIASLSQKFASEAHSLEQAAADIPSLPHVPVDIIANSSAGQQESAKLNLKDLIRNLEKSVLQAKVQLKSEKQALEKAKVLYSNQHTTSISTCGGVEKLRALGRTRNELISWVEGELEKTGDSVPHAGGEEHLQPTPAPNMSIDQQLALAKSQYAHYIASRKLFLDAVCDQIDIELLGKADEDTQNEGEGKEKKENPNSATRILLPYLENLLLISNEQKSLIQQRSHLNISLAKHHKETVQVFDRLAEESHLLSAFPGVASQSPFRGQALSDTFPDDITNEMPSTYHRARSWASAADSAGMVTKEAVRGNVEESKLAIGGVHEVLSGLERLLGGGFSSLELSHGNINTENTSMAETMSKQQSTKLHPSISILTSGSIWDSLDGSLGVLKGAEGNKDQRYNV